MRRLAALFLILISFSLAPTTARAVYVSEICNSGASCKEVDRVGDPSKCMSCEVGVFMAGVSKECGNSGNCTLIDLEQVFVSTGQFVLGIIGAVVLLMYVIGGMYLLTSQGVPGRVSKGKDYIKYSTIGLLIVMFAYLFIMTIKTSLQTSVEESKEQSTQQQNAKDFTEALDKIDFF